MKSYDIITRIDHEYGKQWPVSGGFVLALDDAAARQVAGIIGVPVADISVKIGEAEAGRLIPSLYPELN